jgi:hypothetical protein
MARIANILSKNHTLLVTAVILGSCYWYWYSQPLHTQAWFSIPISFHSESADVHIHAPEHLYVLLAGTRRALEQIHTEHIALHIDARTLTSGSNIIAIDTSAIFLPEQIKLIECNPHTITIETVSQDVTEQALIATNVSKESSCSIASLEPMESEQLSEKIL